MDFIISIIYSTILQTSLKTIVISLKTQNNPSLQWLKQQLKTCKYVYNHII